ncbi:hypothetical protein K438DRAFT_2130997 [Mycena galopus ATCC 62051]|nr:hypothetical protein K438DRAFT_2130997 [Mycena galopus ATCC 62051]
MPRQPTVAETNLDRITTCLTLTLPLLNELHDAFGPPFVQSIANTIQTLIKLVQNKSECAQLMDGMHEVLYAIVKLHMRSEIVGSLLPAELDDIGKFIQTLHKIYTFVEAQQQGNKIKHFFRNNEMNKLRQECHSGLKQAQEVFKIQTQTQTLHVIRDFKQTANLLHQELIELIENISDTSTVSEKSSVHLGVNELKNSSNSFSMLPSKPKIFHGRENELDHILKLISQPSPRIAILGGGGMGKTSLARAVLHHPDICSKFEHRFFVSAEAATTSIELAALVGLHVGLNPSKDLTKPVVQYLSRKMPCLLILDNLETVWEPIQSRSGVEEFLSLLTGLEHLALISCFTDSCQITMRGAERPAKVQWTHPFILPLQPLSNDAARQTFIEITDNSNTIEEIDQLLGFTDNMPLAVDLIAHLVDYEGFSHVLSHWKTEKTSLLSVGFDRQSSLDASISLSLSSPRITPESKELLSLLSVLPNGLSEVELVQGNLGIPNILSCKAALQATAMAYQDSKRRLVLLVPIREYLQQFFPPSMSSIQHIREYFYEVLGLFRQHRGEQMKPVINQISLNLANLQVILHHGLELHTPTLADTVCCTLSLNKFYRFTGQGPCPLLDNIQSILPQLHDHRLETMVLTELLFTQHCWAAMSLETITQGTILVNCINDPILGSKFYVAAGNWVFHKTDKVQLATQFFHKALEMAELSEDSDQQCEVLIEAASQKWCTSDYIAGKSYAAAAQKLSKLSANLYKEAIATYFVAICLRMLGDFKGSAAQLHMASELLHIFGLPEGVLATKIAVDQAGIHLLKSEYQEARSMFCQIAERTSANQNSISHETALLNIATINTIVGEAEKDIQHNLNTAREFMLEHSQMNIVLCDVMQANLNLREGRSDIAKAKFQDSLGLHWRKDPELDLICLSQLANIKAWPISESQGKWATIYLTLAYKSKAKLDLHKALLFLGDVFITTKDDNTATILYQVALEGFTSMDVHQSRAQSMLRLGDLANKHGHTSEAISFWKEARPLFERSLQAKDIAQIDSRLATYEGEGAHQEALVKLKTLQAPVQLWKETSEIEPQDMEEHMVPVTI